MSKCAVLTMTYNEPDFLEMWYRYYSKHFADADIYILDDGSDPEYMGCVAGTIQQVGTIGQGYDGDTHLRSSITNKLKELLKSYEYVLHADTDEFVVPDPEKWPGGLAQYIEEFKDLFAQCSGYTVLDSTGVPFDKNNEPWLAQRTEWHRDWQHYCKVRLFKEDPEFGGGCHETQWTKHGNGPIGEHERVDFRLFHLHYMCRELTWRRWVVRKVQGGHLFDADYAHNACQYYVEHPHFTREQIPEKWRQAL